MFSLHEFIGLLLIFALIALLFFLLYSFSTSFRAWVKKQSGAEMFLFAFILSHVLSIFTGLSKYSSASVFWQILIVILTGVLITFALLHFSKKQAVNWTLVFLIATPAVALVWFMLSSAFGG